jgi:hypothetical protein
MKRLALIFRAAVMLLLIVAGQHCLIMHDHPERACLFFVIALLWSQPGKA